jgi:hypothetical protein
VYNLPFSGSYSWSTPLGTGNSTIEGYLDIKPGINETDFFIVGNTSDGRLNFNIFQSIPETGEKNAWIGPWFENYSGYGQRLNDIPYLMPGLDELSFSSNTAFSYDTLGYLSLWDSNGRPTGNARLILQSNASPVPEPATIILLGAGLFGVAALKNRGKRLLARD